MQTLQGEAQAGDALLRPRGFDGQDFAGGVSDAERGFLESELHPDAVSVSSGPELPTVGPKRGQIAYRDRSGRLLDLQQKNFLIPAGELMPAGIKWTLAAIGRDDVIDSHARNRALLRGSVSEHPYSHAGISYGTLECSGVLAPQLYRGMARRGAGVLVNSASLMILAHAGAFLQQDKQMARFEAVATARPFVQANRGGEAFVLDHQGRFRYASGHSGTSLGSATVSSNSRQTPYDRFGEWLLALASIALLGWLVQRGWAATHARGRHTSEADRPS